MSLINYVEPVKVGEVFLGLSSAVVMIVLAWILYRVYVKVVQWCEIMINREAKYELIEDVYLNRIALKHGVDLDKELMKREMLQKRKSLRARIEDEVYAEMFTDKVERKKGGIIE